MKYASNCIKIHCVGLLPVAVCTHMNDSIVWDRALCCSVPVYKLHSFCINIWLLSGMSEIFFFFKVMFLFFFLYINSLDVHGCHNGEMFMYRFSKSDQIGEGEKREGKMDSLQINKISPIFFCINYKMTTT